MLYLLEVQKTASSCVKREDADVNSLLLQDFFYLISTIFFVSEKLSVLRR